MIPVFTAEQMRRCDNIAIEEYKIPGAILMENASRGSVDVLEKIFGSVRDKLILFICGKGNNGGDGFAMARHCANRGARVQCITSAPDDQMKGDARLNLSMLRNMSEANAITITLADSIKVIRKALQLKPDIIVDAIFGTGLTSRFSDFNAQIVDLINGSGIPVLSVDIPSGVNANNGEIPTVAVKARCTVTMGGIKRGLVFGRGKEHAGNVHQIDISIPQNVYHEADTKTFLVEKNDITHALPHRAFDAHKYQCGKVFVVAGSIGFTGAAAMASLAAFRTGAGIVYLAIPESLNSILEEKVTEVITLPLPQTKNTSFSLQGFEKAIEFINSSEMSVIGPGVSRDEETLELMRKLIQHATKPLLIDADALFALVDHLEILKKIKAPCILTPHSGEFSRLIGISSKEIEKNKVELARDFARTYNCTLVLKGAPTITATTDGNVYINSTGNAGMATAGAGDVLCGVIAGLFAQKMTIDWSAVSGVFIHGMAGDYMKSEIGENGLIATDLLRTIPHVINDLLK